jgi:hypothetical protein
MGSIHKVSCKCGFEEDVTIGGGMKIFNQYSLFPHYCKNCGLVQVNIAENPGYQPACPKCMNPNIPEYGSHELQDPGTTDSDGANQSVRLWGDYGMQGKGNLCPVCKDFSLPMNSMPEILFD